MGEKVFLNGRDDEEAVDLLVDTFSDAESMRKIQPGVWKSAAFSSMRRYGNK